jgi:hypothetical protein
MLSELLTTLELELKPKFICGETLWVADFCIAALYFDIMDSEQANDIVLQPVFAEFKELESYF